MNRVERNIESEHHPWENLWLKKNSARENIKIFQEEEHSIRWQRIANIILKDFGSFEELKVIEIGAGLGTYSGLMAKRGAKVTILDNSPNALLRAMDFMEANGLSAEFIKADGLYPPTEILGKYDISMSFGLAEHFSGKERAKIIGSHFDVLRNRGITFISVPNKYNLPYRLYKFVSEKTNRWIVGEEHPFSMQEMRSILKQIQPVEYHFFGESLISSFRYFFALPGVRKVLKFPHKANVRGCFLDKYLSYALVVYAKK
jgi:2-polyprenyl-3-methyl-5-hydroxy-6-metoxy-1,4-benzoquinol methylase